MNIEAQIDYLEARGSFVDEYLEFHRRILTFQADRRAMIDGGGLALFVRTQDFASRLQRGLPLLERNTLYIETETARSGFTELLSLFEHYPRHYPPGKIAALKRALLDNALLAREFIQAFISKEGSYFNTSADSFAVEPGLLIYIARTISLPFLEAQADLLNSCLAGKDDGEARPSCPFCGNAAAMARLEKEVGQRHLWCAVCHTEWAFTRNRCAYCASEEEKRSRYFYDENESVYRVYVCDLCKRYMKTVDENEYGFIQPIQMALEDLITHHLDEIAIGEGYQSPLWWHEAGASHH